MATGPVPPFTAAWPTEAAHPRLAGAAVVMACTSVCSTALALLLGQLVDGVQRGTLEGRPGETLDQTASAF